MDVIAAIKSRRTCHDWRPEPVAKEILAELLEAAVWAPNHKLTEPWEFYVALGETKEQLARLRAELKAAKALAKGNLEQAEKSYQHAYQELATASAAILVTQVLAGEPDREREDYAAVACAIQNLLLAATAKGLGTFWGTGPVMHHEQALALLGVPAGRRPVGLVFVGHPAHEAPPGRRTPAAEKSFWRE